jgi:hypothetical protein
VGWRGGVTEGSTHAVFAGDMAGRMYLAGNGGRRPQFAMSCSEVLNVLNTFWRGRHRTGGPWPRRLAIAEELVLRVFKAGKSEVAHENVSCVDRVGAAAAVVR